MGNSILAVICSIICIIIGIVKNIKILSIYGVFWLLCSIIVLICELIDLSIIHELISNI